MHRHGRSDHHRAQLVARASTQGALASLGRAVLCAVVVLMTVAPAAAAQGFRLRTISGNPIAFPVPTEANYYAGFVTATALLSFDVDARNAGAVLRNSSVTIRSTTGTMGGTKPIGDLLWRRSDLGVWNPMTTVDAVVEAKDIQKNGINDPWANSIEFRVVLSWANDPPATHTPALVLTLTIAPP